MASSAQQTELFVGRGRELHEMDRALAAAESGEPSIVLVDGPAGAGKTAFCRQAAAHAEGRGFAVGWGTCWPGGGAPPLWPWPAVLAALAGPDAATLTDGDRFTRFAGLQERVGEACSRAPVLVVIDDVPPGDEVNTFARFLVASLPRARLVVLLARRFRPPAPDSAARLIALGSLDLAEAAEFVRTRTAAEFDQRALRALVAVTGGLPARLRQAVPVGGTAPDSLDAAVALAVERLDERIRVRLGPAAVLGSSPVIAEAAAVCGLAPRAMRDVLGAAHLAGIVLQVGVKRFTFSHDLVPGALLAGLDADDVVEAHARAAAVLEGETPARVARRAQHALRAAVRSAPDARVAVAACREAARVLADNFAHDRAAAVLAEAADAHQSAGLREPVAHLLVEWAEAVLRCGRLSESRELFARAAGAADAEGDPAILARAAIGLGGMWVNEHRNRLEWERVVGLQRTALDRLPDSSTELRLRLRVRLAVEDVYRGGPIEPVLAHLAEARQLGDAAVLAEALSLAHHALLTPRQLRVRAPLADELLTVATAAGETVLALFGLCWRTVNLFQAGDRMAERSLEEMMAQADELDCRSVRYIGEVIRTMLLIRDGRLAEAEAKAYECHQLGEAVGDADALGYLGAHLVTIRWLQGRETETLLMMEEIARSPTLNPAEFAFEATVAALAARSGALDRAREGLARLAGRGLAGLPESSTWLAGLQSMIEAACRTGDASVAREAYDLLLPYADQPVMPSLAVTCFGSAERPLGLAAIAFGSLDRGVAHLERALTANRSFGNAPVAAMTEADLAGALLDRGRPDDLERARDLLEHAAAEADRLEMPTFAAAWRDGPRTGTIRRDRRRWTFTLGDQRAVVPDSRGMSYLAQLLTNPGRPIPALTLAGGDLARPARQPVLDEPARRAYLRRAQHLTDELRRADAAGDADESRRLHAEQEALLAELRRSTGRTGRARAFAAPDERARTAVRKAIKRALDAVSAEEPALGAHLQAAVTTGTTCCYAADRRHPIRWTLVRSG